MHAYSLVETSDGGLALTGYLPDQGFGVNEYSSWLVKTDVNGNLEWIQTYNGSLIQLIQTSDRGFALVGGNQLIKTDSYGTVELNQTYSGSAYSLIETSDGGYAIGGQKSGDFWLAKTDEYGSIPEFPTWALMTLLIVASFVAILCKQKIIKTRQLI